MKSERCSTSAMDVRHDRWRCTSGNSTARILFEEIIRIHGLKSGMHEGGGGVTQGQNLLTEDYPISGCWKMLLFHSGLLSIMNKSCGLRRIRRTKVIERQPTIIPNLRNQYRLFGPSFCTPSTAETPKDMPL
jgi:hypothetical protein